MEQNIQPYSGFLNIYKEKGYTSMDVCAKLRGILGMRKIGHAGTLDPMAEGVLPVALGRATKDVDRIGDGTKTYRAGMLLGNLDDKVTQFFGPVGDAIIPFTGFSLGAGINLSSVVEGGISGIVLGLTTIFIGGAFIYLCDHFIGRRPGYAAWAVATTAGNAVAVPAVIGTADPAWMDFVGTATVQVAASTVLSALLVPFIVSWWAKKYGCPKFPKEAAS